VFVIKRSLRWIQLWQGAVYCFDKISDWQPDTQTEKKQKKKFRPAIRCAFCNYVVTSKDEAISMAGQHRHVFTNPGGVTFEIAMYQKADCVQHGFATTEHTWFSGCAWQIALCSNCKSHLGWCYTRADSDSFYGLICEYIIEM